MSVTKSHRAEECIVLQWFLQNGISLYVSYKISLQWIILPRNIEGMLVSEDFLKEKATNYILHSFEKNELYVNDVIQWIHKAKKLFRGAETMWHMLAIREQLNCYKDEFHGSTEC